MLYTLNGRWHEMESPSSLLQIRDRGRLSLIVINARNFSRIHKNFYVGSSHVWFFKHKLRHTPRTIFHIIRPERFSLPSHKLATPLVTHTKEEIWNQPLHYYSLHVQSQAYYNVGLLAKSQHVTRGGLPLSNSVKVLRNFTQSQSNCPSRHTNSAFLV